MVIIPQKERPSKYFLTGQWKEYFSLYWNKNIHLGLNASFPRSGQLKAGLRSPRVSAKFEFRYGSLKSKFSLILFSYNLKSGCSKKNNEIYSRKCFSTKEKESRIKKALYNRPSNNWTLGFIAFDVRRTHPNLLGVLCHKGVIFFRCARYSCPLRFEQLTDRFELMSTLRDLQPIFWTNKQFSNMNSKLL